MRRITRETIAQFLAENRIELNSTHSKLCVPIIDRICRKMSAGIRFFEIKTDGNLICDGHHRYVASLLANCTIEKSSSISTAKMIEWESVDFVDEDWDTPAKIRMLNEQDASFNNIPIAELERLLE